MVGYNEVVTDDIKETPFNYLINVIIIKYLQILLNLRSEKYI